MNRIILSAETNPYFNVAAEYQLFLEGNPQTRLFLWQNTPTVVLGRNQNFSAECDRNVLEAEGILPVRRFSGGGAVFHDLGNVNFTFLDCEENATPDRYLDVLRRALGHLKVPCVFSGRNDLLVDGKKFSGHAFYADQGRYFYHGTIMVNVDLDMLTRALRPSFLKLQSKGIQSVRSRVVNLCEIDSSITVERVKQALMDAFSEQQDISSDAMVLDRQTLSPSVQEIISSREWIFGETPDFSLTFSRRLPFGMVTVSADIAHGHISRIKIHTDGLLVFDWTMCENSLIGELFDENKIVVQIETCYNLHRSSGKHSCFMPGGLEL